MSEQFQDVSKTNTSVQINVLLADDHQLMLDVVPKALSNYEFRFWTATTFNDALKIASSNEKIDIALIDLDMPGVKGIDSLEEIVKKAPNVSVAVFSGSKNYRLIFNAFEVGVRGFVPKSIPLSVLPSALRILAAGQMFVPQDLSDYLSHRILNDRTDGLSDLEKELLQLASAGYTNKEIAQHQGMTEASVKMHMLAITRKLDARNRTHAVVIAKELSII